MTGWTSTFFLMMIIHPEIQRRAQEELDGVVGLHRLPTLQDRVNLPYLRAIQKEIYRWAAIVPLGGLCRVHFIYGLLIDP
jgi:cytochrome P450